MSWGTDIQQTYSDWDGSPEGYELVASVDITEPSYSFDLAIVVAKDGELRWFTDSGCSCPSPFEDTRWEDGYDNFEDLWAELEEAATDGWHTITTADIVDMKRKVHEYQQRGTA